MFIKDSSKQETVLKGSLLGDGPANPGGITPNGIRIRKRHLKEFERKRAGRE